MKSISCAIAVFLTVTILLFSCKKDMDPQIPEQPTFQVPVATPVSGRITGIVVDENNAPVQNAEVKLSAVTYYTDARGLFQINETQLDKYITTITVNKAGYFKALRSFSATASRNYLSIKLIPKLNSGTINSSAGGTISLTNGTTITFPTDGIVVKGTGAAFTGTVNVFASYIDPTSSDFAAIVPGSMMAQQNNSMYVLQSTGMIAVDLESNSGQALQLAAGKSAMIHLPIPPSLLGKAPATIDTWSLDDRGIWMKEGTATKNGNHYEMTVTHFSFWNCDVPANAIYLTIHVKDQNNQPLANSVVQLTIPNNNTWWATTYGITDSTGTVSGLVPANLGLTMNISSNVYNCSTPIATQNVGPFSRDTSINVSVTINSSQSITISGTLNGCNNIPVATGTASLMLGNFNYYTAPIINGSYSFSIPFCTSPVNATVWLVDGTTGSYANPVTVLVFGNTVTVPTQVACGVNQNALFALQGCRILGTSTVGVPYNSNNYMAIIVDVQAIGNYDISTNNINGVQFSGTGTLTHTGFDTIYLPGNGTPLSNGTFTITISPGGSQTCVAVFTVGSNVPFAVFTMGSGICSNINIAGNYVVNFPLNQTNFVTLAVNVTTPGTYNIITNGPINGMNFSGSGTFTTIGQATVALTASGTPLAATTSTFTLQSNGAPGCSFDILTTSTGAASYTFAGAPGSCAGATIAGNYLTGIPLLGQNTVALQIDVLTAGTYSISTNVVNGFRFTGSGVFSTTGSRVVLLTAEGTPTAPGVTSFQPTGGSAQSCGFTVTVN